MNESDYAQSIGVLREIEKTLVNRESWQRAVDAPDISEAMRALGGDYDFDALHSPEAYEPALQAKLTETYERLYEICPEREVVDILNAKYVFHNLRVLVKAEVSEYARANSDAILSQTASVTPKTIQAGLKGGCPQELLDAKQAMLDAYNKNRDPQDIDITADRLMYAYMLRLAEELGNEFIIQYVRMSVDLYNFKMLMRVRNMKKGPRFLQNTLIEGGLTDTALMREAYDKPMEAVSAMTYYKYFGDAVRLAVESYEKTNNNSELEKLFDNLLTRHAARAKYTAFGPEPLFAYILARENEVRQIRIVFTCKLNRISEDTLRERLRDLYA